MITALNIIIFVLIGAGIIIRALSARHRVKGVRGPGLFFHRTWFQPWHLPRYLTAIGLKQYSFSCVLLVIGIPLYLLVSAHETSNLLDEQREIIEEQTRYAPDTVRVYFGPLSIRPVEHATHLVLDDVLDSLTRERDEARQYGEIMRGFLESLKQISPDTLPEPLWHHMPIKQKYLSE